jgi:exo-1,4-beta-D-glucosaminidase
VDGIKTVVLVLLVACLFIAGSPVVRMLPAGSEPEKLFLKDNWMIQASDLVTENGAVISAREFSPAGWYPTSAPSTVLAALVENEVYPDPYFGMNLDSIPDLSESSWWYRTEFLLPEEQENRHIWMHFDGINYKANIWLNGQKIADAAEVQGTYRLFEFDVTDKVSFDQKNCLAVEVFASEEGDLTIYWSDWNPIPPDKNMGLWHDVYIDTCGPVTVRHPYVITDLDPYSLDTAYLTISAELTNNKDEPVNGILRGTIKNVTNTAEGGTSVGGSEVIEFSKNFNLGPKESRLVTLSFEDTAQLIIQNPRLWWPNLAGAQNLYDLRLEFNIADEVSDTKNVRFGIREVSSHISDDGYRIFTVNRRRILVRGGGWCPDMMLRPLPERKEAEIRYAKDMNLNAIRMEGKLGTNELWNLCDKYGIMVMAGWCCGPMWEYWEYWDDTDIKVAVESQKDQILRLRSHPSLLVWLYGSDKTPPPEIEAQYLNILHTYAPTAPYLPSATEQGTPTTGATGVKMRGPYSYEPPIYYYLMESPGGAWGFGTEMGPGENVPPIESIHKMLPDDHLWPIGEYWNYHCGGGFFSNLDVYSNALTSRYGAAVALEDYCMKAQLMNYESMRAELEAWGWNKYLSTGVITWMYNSAWPSLIWQHYDYYLRPGGAYFGAKMACEPLHVQYSYNDDSIYVVNSYYASFENLKVSAKVYDLGMNEKYSNNATVGVGADSSNHVFTLPLLENLTTTYFLNLELEDSSGNPVSSNFYWLSTKRDALNFDETTGYYTPQNAFADFTDLEKLPPVELDATYTIEHRNETVVAHVTVENPTDDLAFFVHLTVTEDPNGEEVLPILWDDNYFCLLPKETKLVNATFSVNDLGGAIPVVEVGGWNIPGKFECTRLELTEAEGAENGTFIVTATIENTFVDGSKIGLYVDDKLVDSKLVWARGETSREVTFELVLDDAEPHEIKVGNKTKTVGAASQPEDLQVLDNHSAYIDEQLLRWYVVGEVQNNGSSVQDNVRVKVTFYNKTGGAVMTEEQQIYLWRNLLPQQKAPFKVTGLPPTGYNASDIDSYEIEIVDFTSVEVWQYQDLEILSSTSHINQIGYFTVEGTVRNVGSMVATDVKIVATFYDASGTVIDAASAYAEPPPFSLSPDQTVSFTVGSEEQQFATSITGYSLLLQVATPIIPEFPYVPVLAGSLIAVTVMLALYQRIERGHS